MLIPGRQFYSDTATYNVGNTTTNSSSFDSTVILLYKHSFSDTPSTHPYLTLPNILNSNLTGSSFTNSRGVWTNYSSNTNLGKAIAMDNSTADTATVTLTVQVANGKKLGIKSYSFYHRVSASGYKYWKMYINGIEAGDSTLYMPTTGGTGNNTMQATGTRTVHNPAENLTGTVTVLLKLYGHDAAYPNGNAQGTFRMDEFILNGYINDDGSSSASGVQYANKGGYRYGFNGKEKSNEIYGEGNAYDMGARLYDPRIGRTPSVDPKAGLYPGVSPYAYALNTPIQAIDPDGNVVIFINGQHSGEGGSAKYWGGYDQRAMNSIGDHSARYVDGALGGFANTGAAYDRGYKSTGFWDLLGHRGFVAQEAVRMRKGVEAVMNESNVNRKVREQAGYAQGGKDANGVFANLTEGESIKIVTHSMGSAFSRGYIQALQEYMKTNNITNHKIELVVDVNAFQGAELNAIPGVTTLNKTGGNDGKGIFKALWYKITKGGVSVPGVGKVKGATDITTPDEKDNSHEIGKMTTDGIPNVGNAGTQSKKPVEQGSNNGEPVKKDE
ncbi:MAG: RHS repeat-associated core domain-containing protein [Ferruginibacter sp.]